MTYEVREQIAKSFSFTQANKRVNVKGDEKAKKEGGCPGGAQNVYSRENKRDSPSIRSYEKYPIPTRNRYSPIRERTLEHSRRDSYRDFWNKENQRDQGRIYRSEYEQPPGI